MGSPMMLKIMWSQSRSPKSSQIERLMALRCAKIIEWIDVPAAIAANSPMVRDDSDEEESAVRTRTTLF